MIMIKGEELMVFGLGARNQRTYMLMRQLALRNVG